MARKKPHARLVKTDGDTERRSTAGRFVTPEAAELRRLAKRKELPLGSSDRYSVTDIRHRGDR